MSPRKHQSWGAGDLFLIPLDNGTFVRGLVVEHVPQALNSAGIALFRGEQSTGVHSVPTLDELVSVTLATRDLLDRHRWVVRGRIELVVPLELRPYERFRDSGWVGAKIKGSAIVESFVNALHGLRPWDMYFDPECFDKMLLSPTARPASIRFKRDFES